MCVVHAMWPVGLRVRVHQTGTRVDVRRTFLFASLAPVARVVSVFSFLALVPAVPSGPLAVAAVACVFLLLVRVQSWQACAQLRSSASSMCWVTRGAGMAKFTMQ